MGQVEKSWFGPAASVTFSSVPKPFKMFITEYSSKIVIGMGGGGGMGDGPTFWQHIRVVSCLIPWTIPCMV